ncbi:MAG: ligase-associated DNA damage response endonuclease PdeM [Marinosulfonomonas sp.]|nr:ligase-associated DNA damage response endonuclease PdeM [Marinosulfonomonas sp.]
MNGCEFNFCGEMLAALPTGALWWQSRQILTVSDLHLGKSERIARRGGTLLPPYETQETLSRLEADIAATNPRTVICLGDSFDDLAAAHAARSDVSDWIDRLQAGRNWVWIEGNHDPGPLGFGGTHRFQVNHTPLTFRHIAEPDSSGEISGHFHPKATLHTRGRAISRPAFLFDEARVILPAYGTYTGGLRTTDKALNALMKPDAQAILTGTTMCQIPMRRGQVKRSSTSAR